MSIIVEPRSRIREEPEKVTPNVPLGKYLRDNLKNPYRVLGMLFSGYFLIFENGMVIGYVYTDEYGNEGIVVLNNKYNQIAVEFAEMYEAAHPESAQVAVHMKG